MPLIIERPVVARIADEIFRRLEQLVIEPNEYLPITEVIRPLRLGGYTPKHLQIVLTRGPRQRAEELDCPGNPPAIAYVERFDIRVHILPSEKDRTPIERYRDLLESQVVGAITAENQWHTMAGDAQISDWLPVEDVDSDGSFAGILIPIAVTYRHAENDSTVAR